MGYISNVIEGFGNAYKSLKSRGRELAIAGSIPMLVACSSGPNVPTQESFREFRDTVFQMKEEGEGKFLCSGADGAFGTPEYSNGFRADEYRLGKKVLTNFCHYKGRECDTSSYDFDLDGDGQADAHITLIHDYFGPGRHLIGVPISEEFRVGEESEDEK